MRQMCNFVVVWQIVSLDVVSSYRKITGSLMIQFSCTRDKLKLSSEIWILLRDVGIHASITLALSACE